MKKILSRISIIALVLVMTMSIAIPAFAANSGDGYVPNDYTVIHSANGYEVRLYHDRYTGLEIPVITASTGSNTGKAYTIGRPDNVRTYNPNWEYDVGYRTGSFGSAQSTGVLGMGDYNAPATNAVTWTLKDGVLFLDGVGVTNITHNTEDALHYTNPFKGNSHIKTIVVGEYVYTNGATFEYLPNLETIIILGESSGISNIGSPNLKTVIVGGNLKDNDLAIQRTAINAFETEYDIIVLANGMRNVCAAATSLTANINYHLLETATIYNTDMSVFSAACPEDVWLLYQNGAVVNEKVFDDGRGDSNGNALRYIDKLIADNAFDNSWDELVAKYAYTVANADLPDWALDLLPDEVRNAPAANPFEQAPVDPPAPAQPTVQFTDVPADAYYTDAVNWAVAQGITSGTSATTFSPDATCTNAQILTFLYRAAGSPKVYIYSDLLVNPAKGGSANLSAANYYFDAVNWAYNEGIIGVPDAHTLNDPCTRANAIEFIWHANGSPLTDSDNKNAMSGVIVSPFSDVDTSNFRLVYSVNWAVEQGITSGTSATTFSPNATCTRGQIVTLLNRAFAK